MQYDSESARIFAMGRNSSQLQYIVVFTQPTPIVDMMEVHLSLPLAVEGFVMWPVHPTFEQLQAM